MSYTHPIQPVPNVVTLGIPPSTNDPTNFSQRADAFLGALPALRENLLELGHAAHGNATAAHERAQHAQDMAQSAAAAASTAQHWATNAQQTPNAWASTGALDIGLGVKTIPIQPGRAFVVGQQVLLAAIDNPNSQRMWGIVTAHDAAGGSLTVDISHVIGNGSAPAWAISVAPAPATRAMPIVRCTQNTHAQPGVLYQLAAPGITLTMPQPRVLLNGQEIGFVNTSAAAVFVQWSGVPVRGMAINTPMRIPHRAGATVVFNEGAWL